MFLIPWLIIGLVVVLIYSIEDIPEPRDVRNNFFRKAYLIGLLAAVLPAFIFLNLMFAFADWLRGDFNLFEAAKSFGASITVDLWQDIKASWNGH